MLLRGVPFALNMAVTIKSTSGCSVSRLDAIMNIESVPQKLRLALLFDFVHEKRTGKIPVGFWVHFFVHATVIHRRVHLEDDASSGLCCCCCSAIARPIRSSMLRLDASCCSR